MLSMTGYGRGRAQLGDAAVLVEVRAVNHRFLDLRTRIAPELATDSGVLEEVVRKQLRRGRIDVSARVEGRLSGALVVDAERASAAFAALRQLRDALAPDEPLPLALLAGVPALFREAGAPTTSEREAAVREAAEQACTGLLAMRRAEGAALAADLSQRLGRVLALIDEIEPALPAVVEAARARLTARIVKLLEGGELALDRQRLELEVAILADRADVSEELTRLRSHIGQLQLLVATGEQDGLGRRMEFLLQELAREANTAGSKVPDARVTQGILALKAELERMREQVQNVL